MLDYEFEGNAKIEMDNPKKFYSFKDPHDWINFVNIRDLHLQIWISYKETPKGYWIVPDYDFCNTYVRIHSKKWTLKEEYYERHRRKYRKIYANIDDALYSYYRKKLAHIRHLEEKHAKLKRIIRHIEEEHNIFGVERPRRMDLRWLVNKFEFKPLRIKRPTEYFLNEDEFSL